MEAMLLRPALAWSSRSCITAVAGGATIDGADMRLGGAGTRMSRFQDCSGRSRSRSRGCGRGVGVVMCSEGEPQRNRLAGIIKNKQRILESQLRSMAEGELESKLALTKAVTKPYSLLDTIAQQIMEGRTAIVLEVARLSPSETPEMLAERCVEYVNWGENRSTCHVVSVSVVALNFVL